MASNGVNVLNRFGFSVLGGVLIVALTACGPPTPAGIETEFVDSAGITIAVSPEFPKHEAGGWILDQMPAFSIGVLDGDPDYQFYQVSGALKLSDGRIAVTDIGTRQLRFFSQDGTFQAGFGREGEGPGEFQDIRIMGTLGSDTVVVLDGRQRRTSRFHPDEGFLGQTVLPEEAGVAMHSNGMFGDGAIVFGGLINWDRGDDTPLAGYERLTNPFHSVSLNGSGIVNFGEFPGTEIMWTTGMADGRETLAAAFVLFGLSPRAHARGGRLALSTRDRYEILVFDPGANLERVIRVDTEPVAVTRAHLEGLLEERLANLPSQDLAPGVRAGFWDTPHAEVMPAFESLFQDSEGYIWVEDKNLPGDTLRTWTVFPGEGVPVTRLSLPRSNRVLDIGPDYVLTSFEDELGVEYVREYRLTRGG